MRFLFSIRFLAAAGAVVGLFLLLTAIFETREALDDPGADAAPMLHVVDFVEQVFSSTDPAFAVVDGVADRDTQIVIDGSRRLTIKAGTPGEQHCPAWGQAIACAVVADLLGEGVVWFAIVPMNPDRTVDLPAIGTLDEGVATLVNGWQFGYAPVLDRRCPDDDFASFRELHEALIDDFRSVYSIDERRLVAVVCRTRVDYAPPPSTTSA
jgi:hypothetical protein